LTNVNVTHSINLQVPFLSGGTTPFKSYVEFQYALGISCDARSQIVAIMTNGDTPWDVSECRSLQYVETSKHVQALCQA